MKKLNKNVIKKKVNHTIGQFIVAKTALGSDTKNQYPFDTLLKNNQPQLTIYIFIKFVEKFLKSILNINFGSQ